jgi:hypothetical protein
VPEPDYQFTAVYVTITDNGAAPGTKPAVNQSTGVVAGPDLSAPGLNWVTGNGYASGIDTHSADADGLVFDTVVRRGTARYT